MNRRQFLQNTAATCLVVTLGLDAETQSPKLLDSSQSFKFTGNRYAWDWSAATDRFRILDQLGRVITSGPLQPSVIVQSRGQTTRRAVAGKLAHHEVQGNRATWTYANVNGSGTIAVAWRFEDDALWLEPVIYESSADEDIVSLNLFADAGGASANSALRTVHLVLPGISESNAVSPIVSAEVGLSLRTSLGRAGSGITQQWALPCHYFAGFRATGAGTPEEAAAPTTTNAFCCGLSDLPNSDLYLEQQHGRASLVFDYRGDLWNHMRGPSKFTLGANLFWAFAPNYYEAIRSYYRGLLAGGVIHKKVNSPRKNATLLTPQWCTWGEQIVTNKDGSKLDQAALEKFYSDLKSSGLRAGLFSIDDQWEGKYGGLEHSAERLPHFEAFLAKLRADGLRLGLWAAFLRCEDPSSLGLTPLQMLRQLDGKPYFIKDGSQGWYLLDFTRPEVQKVIRDRARRFVRRYQPDLVKFDFGYEIPVLDTVAPYDMQWAGERMLAQGLDIVVSAMRQENPDIVVMYYHLSPLFANYLDLHSLDDLCMNKGEYDLEANRRFFFCGLCGEFGMPTYGSTGYDWASAPSIWFDSVAVGTVGCIVSFDPSDDAGAKPTPHILSKYNGFTHLVRPTNLFTVQPLDSVFNTENRGAHASSWARFENDIPVLVALRTQRIDGGAGTTEFGGIVKTTASMVVASQTGDALDRTAKLAIVPYGDGQLTLRRQSPAPASATVTEHYFGGKSQASTVATQDAELRIPLREIVDGTPVEWIEVQIS